MMERASRKILIVDDDRAIRTLLVSCLRHDYTLTEASTGTEALAVSEQFQPDLVLLDLAMPGLSGFDVCRRLRLRQSDTVPHVIMVSAKSSRDDQLRAYEVGGDDYVVKPFDVHEIRSRVHLHFRLRDAQARAASLRGEIASHHTDLKAAELHGTQEIVGIQDAAIFALARLAGCLDYDDAQHVVRLRAYSQLLAEQLSDEGPYSGQIDGRFVEDLHRSSPLHDIGKVAISDSILLKPGKLSEREYQQVMRHTIIGAEMLDEAVLNLGAGGFLSLASVIARSHHEWWDGSGYPDSLVGQDIPLAARIVSVADVYEALTSKRPYRDALMPEDAREEISRSSGHQFDPVIVEALRRRWNDFLEVQDKHGPEHQLATGAQSFLPLEDADCIGRTARTPD